MCHVVADVWPLRLSSDPSCRQVVSCQKCHFVSQRCSQALVQISVWCVGIIQMLLPDSAHATNTARWLLGFGALSVTRNIKPQTQTRCFYPEYMSSDRGYILNVFYPMHKYWYLGIKDDILCQHFAWNNHTGPASAFASKSSVFHALRICRWVKHCLQYIVLFSWSYDHNRVTEKMHAERLSYPLSINPELSEKIQRCDHKWNERMCKY